MIRSLGTLSVCRAAGILLLTFSFQVTTSVAQQVGGISQALPAHHDDYPPPPTGWYVYPGSKLQNPDADTQTCFNYSQTVWEVNRRGDKVEIERRKDAAESSPSLPPRLKHEAGMTDLRASLRYEGNWLLAYNGGEFGGGLWLTNEDGSQVKRIIGDDIAALLRSKDEVFVLSGLGHMDTEFGNAFILSKPQGMNISLQHAISLGGNPLAWIMDADESVLVLTNGGLNRITRNGELRPLYFPVPLWIRNQNPMGMAVNSDGTIYVGMRMFVLRFDRDSQDSDQYTKEWLLPNKCRTFELTKSDCACKR